MQLYIININVYNKIVPDTKLETLLRFASLRRDPAVYNFEKKSLHSQFSVLNFNTELVNGLQAQK